MNVAKNKEEIINSINIAILFSANALTWVLNIDNSIVAILGLCVVLYFMAKNKIIQPRILPLVLFLFLCFAFSYLSSQGNEFLQKYFIEFLMYGCVALLLSQSKFDIDAIITTLCFLSIPVAPFISKIDFMGDTDFGQWMGVSYGSLKFIVALIYALFNIKYSKKWIKIVFAIALIYYVLLFLKIASRGAVLGVMVFIVISFLIKRKFSLTQNLMILAISMLVIYTFFLPIIEYMLSLLGMEGIDFYALEKIVKYADNDMLDNGRDFRIAWGMQMFKDSPLFGNGIAAYEAKYKIGYVHNIFVQQLLEGGIILFLPLFFIMLHSVYIMLSNKYNTVLRLFVAYLFSCNIIGLLFSDYYWRSQGYWFLIGFSLVLYRLKVKRKAPQVISDSVIDEKSIIYQNKE